MSEQVSSSPSIAYHNFINTCRSSTTQKTYKKSLELLTGIILCTDRNQVFSAQSLPCLLSYFVIDRSITKFDLYQNLLFTFPIILNIMEDGLYRIYNKDS